MAWEPGERELRFRIDVAEGARGDQTLADIRSGLLRGASLEFRVPRDGDRLARRAESEIYRRTIRRAIAYRIGVVDAGAYPQSRLDRRMERRFLAAAEEEAREAPATDCGCRPDGDAARERPYALMI